MNQVGIEWCWMLFRANISLIVASTLILLALAATRLSAPKWHRAAWMLVLLQGIMFFPMPIELPWLESPKTSTVRAFEGSVAPSQVGEIPAIDLYEPLPAKATIATGHAEVPTAPERSSGLVAIVAMGIWVMGIVACVSRATWLYRQLLRSLQLSEPANVTWQRQWTMLQRQHNVTNTLPLHVHPELGPMLCCTPRGFQVVVPRAMWTSLSESERESVLLHELAHYRRGDIWVSLVSRLLIIPHWFNPVAWAIVRKIDEAAEWACDERVTKSSPEVVPSYANVLLRMVEEDRAQLGYSAAGGASIARRIRRLCSAERRDTFWRKSALLLTVLTVTLFGAFRFELVSRSANAQEIGQNDEIGPELSERLAQFAARLQDDGDPKLKRLKSSLTTEVGQLVARDRIGWAAEELRRKATDQAIPQYLGRYFTPDGRFKDRAFAEKLVNRTNEYNADIDRIAAELKKIAASVDTDSDENKLLKRFLEHDAAASMMYFRQLRRALRPDASAVAERLGEAFVQINNEYQIRAGAREEVQRVARHATRAMDAYKLIREDVLDYAKEFSDRPGITSEMKSAMQQPTLPIIAAFELAENEEESLNALVDDFFEQIEWIAVDAGDGLVVREEAKDEATEKLAEVRRIEASATRLTAAVAEFAEQVSERDELHRQLKTFLKSDLAPVRIGSDYELSSASPEEAVKSMISEGIITDADGKARLRDEFQGEFVEQARDIMHEFRTLMRKAKPIHRFAEKVQDKAVAAALKSIAGKLVVASAIRKEYASRSFDGLTHWIGEHFEQNGDFYNLREDHIEMVEDFLRHAEEVESGFAADDF